MFGNSMFDNSNSALGRRLIVSDPNKLTYFARANAIRAGVQSTYGALTGVAPGDGEWANPYTTEDSAPGDDRAMLSVNMYNAQVAAGNRLVPGGVGEGTASTVNVETPGGGSTLERFFNAFNKFLSAPGGANPFQVTAPKSGGIGPWVVGAGIVGVGLLVLLAKRKRA